MILLNDVLNFFLQINDLQGRMNSLQQMAAHGPPPPNQWGPQGPPPPSSGPMMPPHPAPNMSDPNMQPQMVSFLQFHLSFDDFRMLIHSEFIDIKMICFNVSSGAWEA